MREGHYPNLETVPQYALTLSIPMPSARQKKWCALCPETRKAAAVKDALKGPISTDCPASYLIENSPTACCSCSTPTSASLLLSD